MKSRIPSSLGLGVCQPKDLEKIDALDAVIKYKPEIVIGSWITHLYNPLFHNKGGSIYGVDEKAILSLGVEKYIMIGNLEIHKNKPILNDKDIKVQVLEIPCIISRAKFPRKDRLFIFQKKQKKKWQTTKNFI